MSARRDRAPRGGTPGRAGSATEVAAGLALMVALDTLLVAAGWAPGGPPRAAVTLLGVDAALLLGWVAIGLPVRRWLARPPH